MKIAGLQKVTLIDYPGKVAATVFTVGCNFFCPFCHNSELVHTNSNIQLIPEQDLFDFFKKRKGKLDGIVITGGEPTIQPDLPLFIEKIKTLGFSIKLDTNGHMPQILSQLIHAKLIDYIAMDIKAPLTKYKNLSGIQADAQKIKESITLIQKSGLPHQFRTTVVPTLLTPEDIQEIASTLTKKSQYKLQPFRNEGKLLDPKLTANTLTDEDLKKWQIV